MSSFRLEELGWKAFQDLCGTILREVLGQTVQVFSEGADAGRDGAFHTDWLVRNAEDSFSLGGAVIQCKHFKSSASSLMPSTVKEELAKIEALVQSGQCQNYVLMSNGKLSAGSETKIREQVLAKGAKSCLILGREWIEATVLENQRLRSLVPRLYGLGDLSQIIDQRAYAQAATLLESLRYDIETFVPTESYRSAVKCLSDHGLVVLLGEPAAGKSVIAATLALSSTDRWRCLTIKAETSDDFTRHWNPHEPNQLFWLDDAFGPTQFQEGLASQWNALLPKMRAATQHGARIVITSRDYIWKSARRHLKLSVWPELESDQVVVDVEKITHAEREAILYNHLRLGRQPRSFRSEVKPYLPAVAGNPAFLPELARRLADPAFTKSLEISEPALETFIEQPEEFLLEVVRNLDQASRAALCLLVMSAGNLPSPLALAPNQKDALEMLGVPEASVRQAFTVMDGSLVKLSVGPDGARAWVARHPTIVDSMTSLMREETELLEVYLRMAKLERLLVEVDCGQPRERSVSVPPTFFALMAERLAEFPTTARASLPRGVVQFFVYRCGGEFLEEYFRPRGYLIESLLQPQVYMEISAEVDLLSALSNRGLVSEEQLDSLADYVEEMAISIPDPAIETSIVLRALLGPDRVARIRLAVAEEVPSQFSSMLDDWRSNYDRNIEPGDYLSPLREAVTAYGLTDLSDQIVELEQSLEETYRENLEQYEEQDEDRSDEARISQTISERSIFDDVDA